MLYMLEYIKKLNKYDIDKVQITLPIRIAKEKYNDRNRSSVNLWLPLQQKY